ncbi:carbamoyltransferase HypF [Pelotalea chapellei]|uniref:carbamoyltransferase HypF n=1 Tax=Pelotalea chapellei TaxID=44671 RepID=UPI003F59E4FB
MKRIRIDIEGIVQGVGFRPFIYRLANSHNLAGWVMNTPSGVVMEVEGAAKDVELFRCAIPEHAPPLALISSLLIKEITPCAESGFVIKESGGLGNEVQIAPDCDVCSDCLAELFDPSDRRYRYPFINCTNCGPRYTIIKGVPYDRGATTMSAFPMCGTCRNEYHDPNHRRFHAQPNACPVCGPVLTLLDGYGKKLAGTPLDTAISLLKEGRILAVKGLGGYHLAVDAANDEAVRELRRRKKRDEKPFAVMSPDLAAVAGYAVFDEMEKKLLSGVERPIVLLSKREGNRISPLVAPNNGYFGVMLPYTPLHHLLLRDNFNALVMTSGNLSNEPISYTDGEALERLGELADFFLIHNREIHTRTDDSIIRVFQGNPLFLRRSRGYVPRAISLPPISKNVLAVGAELKGTICLTKGNRAFLSQHIGDLQNAATLRSLEDTVCHLEQVLKIEPEVVAYDLHPDYLSTGFALDLKGVPKIGVQHHHAHMASCMAENRLEGEVIGVIFDGTGYGPDGTIWGGEFLVGGYAGAARKGHFRTLPLPGGDAAVREPYRMALSYLHSVFGAALFDLPLACIAHVTADQRKLFLKMLERGINSPLTSSCGRLFDAIAALIGLRTKVSYEGQAAIELEALAESVCCDDVYPCHITASEGKYLIDFSPMIRVMVEEMASEKPIAEIARCFHNTVAVATAEICGLIRGENGMDRVVLTGGVYQNKLLTEGVMDLLKKNGFQVFIHRLAPPNDAGIALGQAIIAGRSFPCV